MKIAIIGADGQLGSDLVNVFKGEKVFPFYYPDFDITKPAPGSSGERRLKICDGWVAV